jgi:Mor family transcriptional regulator
MAEQAEVTAADVSDDERLTLHADMVGVIVATVMRQLAAHHAVAEAVNAAVRLHMGGRRVYVPMTDAKIIESDIRTRDEAVRRAFNGHNMTEVCKAFGLSRASFYRAINPKARKTAKKRAHRAGGAHRG